MVLPQSIAELLSNSKQTRNNNTVYVTEVANPALYLFTIVVRIQTTSMSFPDQWLPFLAKASLGSKVYSFQNSTRL